MLRTADPLGERLALMWHNHFATSFEKVQSVALMRDQNEIFRTHARSPFPLLLPAAIKDPAMLLWLDADANRKDHPNENLAREIMELFTLGIDSFRADPVEPRSSSQPSYKDGTGEEKAGQLTHHRYDYYTETDIQQAARALTGWTVANGSFRVHAEQHDTLEKTIFGQRGTWDGDDLLRLLIEHPATPRRLAWRICNEFMGESCVTQDLLAEMSELLADNGLNLGLAVETLLRSEVFFEPSNVGTRVASPVEFIVAALRSLELLEPPPSTLLLAEWAARMGQSLFNPPNVFGWPGGRDWLTTRTMISRANFSSVLIAGEHHNPSLPPDTLHLAKRYGFETRREQQQFFRRILTNTSGEHFDSAAQQSLEEFVVALLTSPSAQLH